MTTQFDFQEAVKGLQAGKTSMVKMVYLLDLSKN